MPVASFAQTSQALIWALGCLFGLLSSTPSLASELYGRVVGVSDGDTITVLDAHQVTHKVRLSGIDAPEKAQAYGERAKQQLSDKVFQESVRVIHDKTDRYGRIVGKVTLNGEDVNLQMIHAGLAWHYKAYEDEQPALDRVTYPLAELNARRKAIGLWGDVEPVPPWEWRRNKRQH